MVSQTSVIFFGLLVGFIVFITVRGELSSYLYVLGLSRGTGVNLGPAYVRMPGSDNTVTGPVIRK